MEFLSHNSFSANNEIEQVGDKAETKTKIDKEKMQATTDICMYKSKLFALLLTERNAHVTDFNTSLPLSF